MSWRAWPKRSTAQLGKALSRSRILVVGLAYKKNVPDIRESPSLKLIELIEERGGMAAYHDPHVAEIPSTREHASLKGRTSVPLDRDTIGRFRCGDRRDRP